MAYPLGVRSASILKQKHHRHATLWKVERKDGTVLYFTDHDRVLTFQGQNYYPSRGFDASARQAEVSMRESDVDLRGILSSDKITFNDLHARRYDDAKVTESTVDWRYCDVANEAIVQSVYFVDTCTWDGVQWSARLISLAGKMRKVVGWTLTKSCRYELGDEGCTINLESAAYKYTLTVASIVVPRRVFTVSANAAANNLFTLGRCLFTTGDNSGIEATIGLYSSSTVRVYLFIPMPLDITVGDAVTLRAGCNKIFNGDCKVKFNNGVNFGGRKDAPGTNEAVPIKV